MLEHIERFINAFPSVKEDMSSYIGEYALKNTTVLIFERLVKKKYTQLVKENLTYIKDTLKGKAIHLAYLDVARYQTDVIDSAIQWGVDDEVLEFLLDIKPPPTSTEDRLNLEVPAELKKLRECF